MDETQAAPLGQMTLDASALGAEVGELQAAPGARPDDPAGAAQAEAPIQDSHLRVDIRDIHAYERNPRTERNPLYYELKRSIRERGLDQALPITRRPGEAHYIIRAGGNTRLEILHELYAETGEERFRQADCLYRPWQSEADVLIAHLTENDLRVPLTFIERARAVMEIERLLAAETGTALSRDAFVERLAARYGYRVSRALVADMEHAVEVLLPVLPQALRGEMGRAQVERLRAIERFLVSRARKTETTAVWAWLLDCLKHYDCPDCWDFTPALEELTLHLAQLCDEPIDWVKLDIEDLLKGKTDIHPYVMPEEMQARLHPPRAAPIPIRAGAWRRAEDCCPAGREPPSSVPVSIGDGVLHGSAPDEPAGSPETGGADTLAREAFCRHLVSVADDDEVPAPVSSTPLAEAPAFGLAELRQVLAAHGERLAEQGGLGRCVAPLGVGIGFFMDLPSSPLVCAGPSDVEARSARKRVALWWLLASLSEQFLHGIEDLARGLRETRRVGLLGPEGAAGTAALARRLVQYVGEPAFEALGRDLFAQLTETEGRDLAALLTARRALEAACKQRGSTSPWEA